MKHPIYWKSNILRRLFLVIAFPLTLFILFFAWLVRASETFYEELKYDTNDCYNTVKVRWKKPKY